MALIENMDRKIKIGILTNSLQLELWKDEILKEIQSLPYVDVCVFIKRNEIKPLTKKQKIWKFRKSIIYKILEKIDIFLSRKLTKKHVNAFTKVDYSKTKIPLLDVYPKTTKFLDIIQEEDIRKIQKHELDIILRFGFRILKGDILNKASKYGVWSFHHGDNKVNRGGPPGFWEVIEGWKETGCVLQKLSDDLDGGYVLSRTWVGTYKHNIIENKNRIYWRATKIIPRLLKEIHDNGYESFYNSKKSLNSSNDFYTRKLYKAPSNTKAFIILFKYTSIVLKQIFSVLFTKDQWFLLYKKGKIAPETSFRTMKKIVPPKNIFWADPFIISKNNIDYIFVEEYDFSIKKGYISVIELFKNKIQKVTKVIDNDYHFSYPFIFEYSNEIFMIPETSENKTVELYKCNNFPYDWSFQKNIFENISAVDTTLFYYDNTWWLFTSIDETNKVTRNDELFVFYANSPLDCSWIPHPMNPVVSDAKLARPAGKIFIKNNKIYRPSQDCTGVYGSSININQIKTLDRKTYLEEHITNLKPEWDKEIKGIHTLNFNDHSTVIDGFKTMSKFF
ncbi:MAG: hypothetical protein JXQ93_13335 [Flavobacteriaceae bacterium]